MKTSIKKACVVFAAGAGLILGAAGGADAIVGGTESATGARPYQVSLQADGGHYCGGSILDATTIVTAAHCVEGETPAGTTIRAGVTDVTSAAGQDVAVASITPHPSYAENGLADIAIIKLAEPLSLGGNVQPISLASAAQVNAAESATVSGWGTVSEDGDGSNQLLEVAVPLVSDQACNAQLGTDADLEVCAGGTGTDACYGDSGGPLVVDTASGPALAGVVSWGDECGGAAPGVYADVPGLTDWVNQTAAQPGSVNDTPTDNESPVSEDADDDLTTDESDADPSDLDADFEYDFEDSDFDDADFEYDFDDADFEYDFDDSDFDDADFDVSDFDDGDFFDGGVWFYLDSDDNLWVESDTGDLLPAEDFWSDDFSPVSN